MQHPPFVGQGVARPVLHASGCSPEDGGSLGATWGHLERGGSCYSVSRGEEPTRAGLKPSWEESKWPQLTHDVAPRELREQSLAGRENIWRRRGEPDSWQCKLRATTTSETFQTTIIRGRFGAFLCGNVEPGCLLSWGVGVVRDGKVFAKALWSSCYIPESDVWILQCLWRVPLKRMRSCSL